MEVCALFSFSKEKFNFIRNGREYIFIHTHIHTTHKKRRLECWWWKASFFHTKRYVFHTKNNFSSEKKNYFLKYQGVTIYKIKRLRIVNGVVNFHVSNKINYFVMFIWFQPKYLWAELQCYLIRFMTSNDVQLHVNQWGVHYAPCNPPFSSLLHYDNKKWPFFFSAHTKTRKIKLNI